MRSLILVSLLGVLVVTVTSQDLKLRARFECETPVLGRLKWMASKSLGSLCGEDGVMNLVIQNPTDADVAVAVGIAVGDACRQANSTAFINLKTIDTVNVPANDTLKYNASDIEATNDVFPCGPVCLSAEIKSTDAADTVFGMAREFVVSDNCTDRVLEGDLSVEFHFRRNTTDEYEPLPYGKRLTDILQDLRATVTNVGSAAIPRPNRNLPQHAVAVVFRPAENDYCGFAEFAGNRNKTNTTDLLDQSTDGQKTELSVGPDLIKEWFKDWMAQDIANRKPIIPNCIASVFQGSDIALEGGVSELKIGEEFAPGEAVPVDLSNVFIKADSRLCLPGEVINGYLALIADPLGSIKDQDLCNNIAMVKVSIQCPEKPSVAPSCRLINDPLSNGQRAELQLDRSSSLTYNGNGFVHTSPDVCLDMAQTWARAKKNRFQLAATLLDKSDDGDCEDITLDESQQQSRLLTKLLAELSMESGGNAIDERTRVKRQLAPTQDKDGETGAKDSEPRDRSDADGTPLKVNDTFDGHRYMEEIDTLMKSIDDLKQETEAELERRICFYKNKSAEFTKKLDVSDMYSRMLNRTMEVLHRIGDIARDLYGINWENIDCGGMKEGNTGDGTDLAIDDMDVTIDETFEAAEYLGHDADEKFGVLLRGALAELNRTRNKDGRNETGVSSGETLRKMAEKYLPEDGSCPSNERVDAKSLLDQYWSVVKSAMRAMKEDTQSFRDEPEEKCGEKKLRFLLSGGGKFMNNDLSWLPSDDKDEDSARKLEVAYVNKAREVMNTTSSTDLDEVHEELDVEMNDLREMITSACSAKVGYDTPTESLPTKWKLSGNTLYMGVPNPFSEGIFDGGRPSDFLWRPVVMCRCDNCQDNIEPKPRKELV